MSRRRQPPLRSARAHDVMAVAARLKYAFESFEKTGFRTDTLVPVAGADIFLGNDLKDYTAHILAFILG